MAQALILPHIFLGRPEKPITMDVCVNQSPVAPGLSRCAHQTHLENVGKRQGEEAGGGLVKNRITASVNSCAQRMCAVCPASNSSSCAWGIRLVSSCE